MDKLYYYKRDITKRLLKAYDELNDTLAFIRKYGNADRLSDLVEYQKRNLHIYCRIATSLGILKSYKE